MKRTKTPDLDSAVVIPKITTRQFIGTEPLENRPAVPTLFLVPEESGDDYRAIFAIATAYAQAGILLSERAHRDDQTEFVFPAVVCSSFAIELFLKAFISLENSERPSDSKMSTRGHTLNELWKRISQEKQALVIGMHRNPGGIPSVNGMETRKRLFAEALTELGEQPFVKWRYPYEIDGPTLMSHALLVEITDTFGSAAVYLLRPPNGSAQSAATDVENSMGASDSLTILGSTPLLPRGRESPLRRIPSNLEPAQARLLNAIRHSVETMDVTFSRLREMLTAISLYTTRHSESISQRRQGFGGRHDPLKSLPDCFDAGFAIALPAQKSTELRNQA